MRRTLPLPPSRGQGSRRVLRGAVPLALGALLCCSGARAAETLEEGLFRVVHSGRSERTARFVLEEAGRAARLLEETYGGEFRGPVTIVLLDRAEGGDPAAPGGLPDWFAGVAFPRGETVFLKTSTATRFGPAELEKTLMHEMTHLYLAWRAGRGALPRWFEEGLAMRQSGEHFFLQRVSVSAAAVRGELPALASLERAFPGEEWDARLAYGASLAVVGRLAALRGEEGVGELLDLVAVGDSFREAFRKTYGLGLAAFEGEWRRSLVTRSRWIAAAAAGSTIWSLMAVLFLLVYWRKRVTARRKLAAMDADEIWG